LWLDISNVFVQKLQSQRLNIKKAINLLEEICTVPPCVAAFAADVLSSNAHMAAASFYIFKDQTWASHNIMISFLLM